MSTYLIDEHEVPRKPRLRGVSHQVAFFAVLIFGPVLVAIASTPTARLTCGIYALSMAAMFGCSALLHRGTWRPEVLPWMRRLDHSTIFVFIAGTYTPIVALSSMGAFGTVILAVVWTGAAAGVGVTLFWLHAPRWVTSACYLVVGWTAVIAFPQLWSSMGVGRFALLASGGVIFSLGAVVYARKRPDPWPRTFGYHEVFHSLVIIAVILHYVLIISLIP